MSANLFKTSKSITITGIVLFIVLVFKSFFSLNQFSFFQPQSIPYVLACCIPFTLFICSKLSPDCGKNPKAVDIAALIAIVYTVVVTLDDTIIRYTVLTTIGIICIALILSQNIFTLIAAAGLCLLASFEFEHAAPIAASLAICISMVRFSYLFQKKASAKKNKKTAAESSLPDYKKEKILFLISELVLFAAFAVSIYYRKNTIALITFMSNIEYIIPAFVVAIILVALAVMSVKSKRPFTEVIGYIIAIAAMPLSLLSEYSVAASGVAGAFYLLLSLCDGKAMLPAGVYAEKIYGNAVAKIKEKRKTAEE